MNSLNSIFEKKENKQLQMWRFFLFIRYIFGFTGFFSAIYLAWNYGISMVDIALFIFFISFTGFGFVTGYHRLFAHRAFEALQPVRIILAVAGLMGSDLTITEYVTVHRCHHAFSDRTGDPHSPHLQKGKGISKVLRGLWHAHSGWLFTFNPKDKNSIQRYSFDMVNDRVIATLDRLHHIFIIFGLVLPATIGFVVTETWSGALTAFVWSGLFRMFVQDQTTSFSRWSSHYIGERAFNSDDFSKNNWRHALTTFGEWHNNHHAFPNSAKQSLEPWQIDISYILIVALEKLSLVRNVKRVSTQAINGTLTRNENEAKKR